ncbi:glycerophosphodiester phosphodiesterase [Sphingobacterium spiritivorum]|uniref:glycerophosphodiester phosphodiesterase n=1 Tax=Sphingobacterium spiritivorum TaxID=258 RepID=UPI003DA5D530
MKNLVLSLLILGASISAVSAQKNPIIAHRGAWKNTNLPQNSLASLDAAITEGVFGSEFDVHLTKDDVLVVNHDNDFYGLDIATSTYDELLKKKHPNGESIPTAEEYLKEGLKQKKTKLIYELKTNKLGLDRTLLAAQKSVELVKKLKGEKMVEYIAFDYNACKKIVELNPKAKVHYLMGDKSPQELKNDKMAGADYHFSVYKKNPTWIKELQNLGLKVNAWTVNTEEEMQILLDQKVDYLTTDNPELLAELLKSKK